MENPAETSAMVAASRGKASSDSKVQAVAYGGEAGPFEQGDEIRQRPDRERIGGGEALLDTADGEVGGQAHGADGLRQVVGQHGLGIVQQPGAGVSSALEASMRCNSRSELLRRNTLTSVPVSLPWRRLTDAGVKNGNAVGDQLAVGLAQPKLPAGQGERAAPALEVGVVHRFGAGEHGGGKRADDGGGTPRRAVRRRRRGGQELPGRDAGSARHNQLGGAGKAPEHQDAAKQDGEGQDLQHDVGQPQRRDLQHQAEGGLRLGRCAAQQLDEVEQRHQPGQGGDHRQHRGGELPSDIQGQRGGDHAGLAARNRPLKPDKWRRSGMNSNQAQATPGPTAAIQTSGMSMVERAARLATASWIARREVTRAGGQQRAQDVAVAAERAGQHREQRHHGERDRRERRRDPAVRLHIELAGVASHQRVGLRMQQLMHRHLVDVTVAHLVVLAGLRQVDGVLCKRQHVKASVMAVHLLAGAIFQQHGRAARAIDQAAAARQVWWHGCSSGGVLHQDAAQGAVHVAGADIDGQIVRNLGEHALLQQKAANRLRISNWYSRNAL